MRVDIVRLAERDIHVAAIRLPARLAGGKMLVRVSDAPVMLFAEFVLGRIRIRIAALPERFDERVALLVVAQALEGLQFLIRDDPVDILVHPLLVRPVQLLLEFLLLLESLLVGELPLQADPDSECLNSANWEWPGNWTGRLAARERQELLQTYPKQLQKPGKNVLLT